MACGGGCCAASDVFGSKVAERDLKRYRRRGPGSITRLLLQELRRSPLKGVQLLDIGGGIGVIPAELADSTSAATLVEASSAYLEVAAICFLRPIRARGFCPNCGYCRPCRCGDA